MLIMFDISFYNFSTVPTYNLVYDMAKMSRNVYYKLKGDTFLNVTLPEVYDISIDNDTVRSYLFTNKDRDINVIAFKGTSLPWFSYKTDEAYNNCENIVETFEDDLSTFSTSANDKANDNLYFSCCFYKHNTFFGTCENCTDKDNSCCKSCYTSSTLHQLNYINIAKTIVDNTKNYIDFDNSIVIFTGHSLGGTLASMMGLIYNKVAISFESPGDENYVKLIGLGNENFNNIYHFGHNADPLFTGNCGKTCSTVGYYVDTKCHVGNTCSFNSKDKLGYSTSIFKHRIDYVINNIIPYWETDFPECIELSNCTDCDNWSYN